MEQTSDSQLSDAIRAGRMNDSQSASNLTFDFSQKTMQKIEEGAFLLPELSQRSADELQKAVQSTEMNNIYHTIEEDPNFHFSGFSLLDGTNSRQPGLKRRTKKIEKFETPSIFTAPNEFLGQEEDYVADISDSFESNMTMTQLPMPTDSQSPVKYLRTRTEEEQEKHKQKKMAQKLADSMRSMKEEPPLFDEMMVFAEQPSLEEEQWMTLHIEEKKQKKKSDFSYEQFPNGETYLWTKWKCLVPFEVKWTVGRKYADQRLRVRVRYVHYDSRLPLENAVFRADVDVKKCLVHSQDSNEDVPADSFFYVLNSGTVWTYPSAHEIRLRGRSFDTLVEPGVDRLNFYVKFACSEKCMQIEDRRKNMSLVVYLEDENGLPILHTSLTEVRVVAYPRRDRDNFCQRPKVNPRTELLVRPQDMPNTDNQMSSFSSYRKRPASNNNYNDPPQVTIPVIPRGNDHQRQLMLGRRPPQPQPTNDTEVVDLFAVNENSPGSSAAKKSRVVTTELRTLVVTPEEYAEVMQILGTKARNDRSHAARSLTGNYNPVLAQCQLAITTDVFTWLDSVNKHPLGVYFKSRGLNTIEDLIKAFDANPNVFSSLGMHPDDLRAFHSIFLNYLRIHQTT